MGLRPLRELGKGGTGGYCSPTNPREPPMTLVEINPRLDWAPYAEEFARTGRVQVRDLLSDRSAHALQALVRDQTPWGLAWRAGHDDRPHLLRRDELSRLSAEEGGAIQKKLFQAMLSGHYGFAYSSFPLAAAEPGSQHEELLKGLNEEPFLGTLRNVSGIPELVVVDGQATLYAQGHFLAAHDDSDSPRGRRVAYVINLTVGEWRPEWGGYLNFYDDRGDIERAFRPRFNSLNLFSVPQWHGVGHVAPFGPVGRFAITGWGHDRF